jgi:Sulfotransferase domain
MNVQAAAPQQTSPQIKSGLVWLASYPKSGNTWTRAFLSNLASIIDGAQEQLDINSIGRFSIGENFAQFYTDRLGFAPTGSEDHRKQIAAVRHAVQQEEIADKFDGLIFVKTHNALAIDRGYSLINFAVTSGAVYIVRNPLDVAISLSHHMNKTIDQAIETMGSLAETPVSEKKVHEVWDSWSNHVFSWTGKPHRAIYVMRYEDMLSDTEKTFGGLAEHLLLGATPEQVRKAIDWSSFDNLKNQEQEDGFKEKPEHAERFFREGRAGQWKDVLSSEQVDRIVNDHGEQMRRFGYLPLP